MLVETRSSPSITWKDKLLVINSGDLDKKGLVSSGYSVDEDLEILEGDIHRSMVNGIPTIDFSERIQQILYKEMERTVVIKLLRRNIGYGALNTRALDDLWTIFDCPTLDKGFTPSQAYPNMVLAWIRLLGLPGFLYKRRILEEIGGIIGKVVRLDFNTDSRTRGRFARMAVYINLDKPLIAQVLVNDLHQKVEYEALPIICFTCGKYGHTKELCVTMQPGSSLGKEQNGDIPAKVTNEGDGVVYGPWMLVEKKIGIILGTLTSGTEDQSVDFGDSLKTGKFIEQMWKNNRGKEKVRGIKKNFGPKNFKVWRPAVDGAIGPYIAATPEAIGTLGPNEVKSNMATSCDGPSQVNGVLDRPSTKSGSQVDIPGGFSKSLNGSNSDGDASDIQTKADSMVLELVEIQVTDSIGGLNPQRHTVVSFNKKEPVGGDQLRKKNAPNSRGNKLAQIVSTLRGDVLEVVSPDSGKVVGVVNSYELSVSIILSISRILFAFWKPRVSGKKANAIIDKLGFDFSHRIESIGFAGGIWGNSVFNSFYIFVVYGSPDRVKRKTLWTNLLEVLPPDPLPWRILMPFFLLRIKKVISQQDFGFIGPDFTWQRGNIHERIDRALANDSWISAFPVERHKNFKELVSTKWRFTGMRKRHLMKVAWEYSEGMGWSSFSRLVDLEMEVRDELENVLNHEELLWRQKAKCDWLQFGDRNTKYFHSRTMQRRKLNRILALRISSGEWSSDQSVLRDEAARFF
ncbi:hypothetical protein CXB51_020076 [Gossypium anomalum]|uniref:CCHC-type domain-containing protein n=1 Tax=Gossypium anomalum TaxID=47600 RepID=A0A8J5YQ61_9ROSI|nr:hypothetical protein CXB51_020076 [Gossypium anomalum]